jgi:large subunit ribosomal protein L4
MKAKVYTFDNKESGEITLSDSVFGAPARKDILARVVNWQLAKRRGGNHKTKGISEISGTTKKPHNQKGTGRARQGSLRSPHMRGGAVIFGPVVRDHGFSLPKKIRALGLKTALSAKAANNQLFIIKDADLKSPKVKDFKKIIANFGWTSALIIDADSINENLRMATASIHKFDVLPTIGANVYDILNHDNLVLTEAAVKKLEERLA